MPSFDNAYARQLTLLMDVLPHVAQERDFALKGGTAINLFFRDLPRLSVDIDLAWLPLGERPQALAGIDAGLDRIAERLRGQLRCQVRSKTTNDGVPVGLLIEQARVGIKIDVTPVLRGTVFSPELRGLQPAAEERFGLLEVQTLGFADLFAGKLVAALDRQHPRDLFDVMHLFLNEGLTDELWAAFLVYMTATGRPAAELIDPRRLPLEESFVREFAGMTEEAVTLADLEQAREVLICALHARLDENVRAFLLSVENESPDWPRLNLPEHVPELPAIRWKLVNLATRSPAKRAADFRQLAETLDRIPSRQ
jgi:Nucleotidyl transferase AbiEii toxin, Type IV TA system